MISICSWNVNGIRASVKKGFWKKIQDLKLDIIAIQELKAGNEVVKSNYKNIVHDQYILDHLSAEKAGYSGVGIFTKNSKNTEIFNFTDDLNNVKFTKLWTRTGLDDEEFDVEGRLVYSKYSCNNNFNFVLINAYYPQGGRGDHRIKYKIAFYKKVLELAKQLKSAGECVILCGDFNTTVGDIDLARPKENRNTTGCLPNERAALEDFFNHGFIDVYRHFYPDLTGVYTYWDQKTKARERNVGWRIDYFLMDSDFLYLVKDIKILTDVLGSDHCPVVLELLN